MKMGGSPSWGGAGSASSSALDIGGVVLNSFINFSLSNSISGELTCYSKKNTIKL